jgi:hypothetical protein
VYRLDTPHRQHVHAALRACCMCMLHVHAACACCMCMLHVHAACACCMCMLHVYTHCIYQAALGPHADRPGATGGGMSTDALVAAWQKPFRPEAEGGCPAQEAATPWFEVKPPMVEALAPL